MSKKETLQQKETKLDHTSAGSSDHADITKLKTLNTAYTTAKTAFTTALDTFNATHKTNEEAVFTKEAALTAVIEGL